MTDGDPGTPQGGYPPTPPPQQPQAQQPYAQQPQQAYAQPTQPKKRRGWIVAVVVGVIAVCGLLACVGVLLGGSLFDNMTKKAVALAETHYAAAMSAVETASAAIKDAPTDPARAKPALEQADKALRTGRDEIAAAKAAIEPIDASAGKTKYLESLAAANSALDSLQDMIAYLNAASGMIGKVQEAGRTASGANDALNDAISAGNRSAYDLMKSKATLAVGYYTTAATLFREAHKLDPSAGLDKAAAYAAKRKEQAELVRRMADEGKADKVDAYNKDIEKMKRLGAQAEKIGDPAIVADPQWAQKRLADLEQRIGDAGAKADQLHAVALKELGMTE